MSTITETKSAADLLFGHYLRTGQRLIGVSAEAFLETKAREGVRAGQQKSADSVLFAHYLRAGERLFGEAAERLLELKFNQCHNQEDGRFTFSPCGASHGASSAQMAKRPRSGTAPYPVRITLPASGPAKDPAQASIHPDNIRTIMPAAGKRADVYSRPLSRAMSAHGIHSPEQQAVFLAQVSVESAHLRHTAENLNYSAERIAKVWPSRFPNVESAKTYAHNPEALANRVYGDRLGNSGIEGAGYRFRGRGLIQVTGRDGYRAIGYENNPEALELPEIAAASAAKYWRANNLHLRTTRELTRREFDAISRYVNGGNHGINERWAAYQRALVALKPKESAK